MKKEITFLHTSGSAELADPMYEAMSSFLGDTGITGAWRIDKCPVVVDRFSNNNLQVRLGATVRDTHALILHTQTENVHDMLWELFLMIHTIKNSKARSISLVMPYMDYARSDKRNQSRVSVGGIMLAEILNFLGADDVLLVESHSPYNKNNFKPMADEISLSPLMAKHVRDNILPSLDPSSCVMVFPDFGSAARYMKMVDHLRLSSAVIQKRRLNHEDDAQVYRVMADTDLSGKTIIIVDDELASGDTLLKLLAELKQLGVSSVYYLAAHGILSHKTMSEAELIKVLEESLVDYFGVCDTVPLRNKLALQATGKFHIIPAISLIAEAATRMVIGERLSPLHKFEHYGF